MAILINIRFQELMTEMLFFHRDTLAKYLKSPELLPHSYSRGSPLGDHLRKWMNDNVPLFTEHNPVTDNYMLPQAMLTRKELRSFFLLENKIDESDAERAISVSRFYHILQVWLFIVLLCVLMSACICNIVLLILRWL